ncbi:hypothetical protein KAFR_0C02490 [Kazachstania africana CBS 2517]|uniref:HTH CENPB-type domain-containing protein n=1 Tax=Kazachstania africana (strain ATCC 22294 / BCRC 22015 / CBS 2517 / CECT 1963 / NBRC 1671 / NRRL Y-8276) TaxID=1071382 RepID=H2AS92_KAZAF|nr:hypothetical protein KAFR_0C02490 [Kazachstania africana CBS 2517]CCF57242.1 hypothetical protein KAFR_0C02490 [Kazachstania africana CBS 2517]
MLSIEQRYNICLMAERHPKWTQLDLAKWAYDTFQLPKIPSQGTISRLLAKKAIYMNSKENEKDANRLRKPNNVLVRKILQEWISQSIWNGIPITSPIIQDTAQSVWHRIPAKYREGNGSFSYKWISNFLSKMDVNISMLDEELPKTPKIWTFEERNILKDFFSKIRPNDLFTLDETFLAYNLPLDYSQYETSNIQRKIEVATVMLCSNLTGTEKLKPLVVGKYNSYKSFRNYFPNDPIDPISQSQLGEKMAKKFDIDYHSNRKSWLTSSLFHNWLARWDKRLVADNRKIWIVLDDSCSHRIINLHLQNITLVYSSSNSRFLPFNWGVLDEFKTRYRIQQYEALINLQKQLTRKTNNNISLISFEQSQLTMSNAFKFIKKAWDGIPIDTIKANWKSSGIIPSNMINLNENISMAFKKNDVLMAKLDYLCNQYNCGKKWDSDMLLDLNIENKNTNFLSSEELVESAIIEPMEPFKNKDDIYITGNDENNDGGVENVFELPTYESNANADANINTNNNVDGTSNTNTSNNNNVPEFSTQENVSSSLASIDNELYSNLQGLFNDPYSITNVANNTNINNSQNYLYNVSTLIDCPDLFVVSNVDDLNLAVDIQTNDENYFKDVFSSNRDAKPSQTTAVGATTSPNTALAVNANNIPTAHSMSNNVNRHTSDNISGAHLNHNNTSNNINHPSNDTFEVSNFNHILDNTPTSIGGFPQMQNHMMDATLYSLASIDTSMEIAQSFQKIISHYDNNELTLSKATINEIKSSYNEILKKIKKTRMYDNKNSKLNKKNSGVNLENLLQDPNVTDNINISSMF